MTNFNDDQIDALPPDMIRRAVYMADEAMLMAIQGCCTHLGYTNPSDDGLYIPSGVEGQDVKSLSDASAQVVEAYWWLHKRGRANLIRRGGQDVIAMTKRP